MLPRLQGSAGNPWRSPILFARMGKGQGCGGPGLNQAGKEAGPMVRTVIPITRPETLLTHVYTISGVLAVLSRHR